MAEMNETAFLSFLKRSQAAISAEIEKGLKEGAKDLQQAAKDEIGTYQTEDMGGAAPWDELADSTKEDRVRHGFPENEPGRRSGEMAGSYSAEAEGMKITLGSTSDKAKWFEDGTPTQPPRSVIIPALFRNDEQITKRIALRITRALAGRNQ